jgi:hypothetical protein
LDSVPLGSRSRISDAGWNLLRSNTVEWPTCSIGLEATMNGLIYLVGLIVVIMFILSFLGLH